MWILAPKSGLWHHAERTGDSRSLCGAALPLEDETRTSEQRPIGFQGLLCNRCWFRQEMAATLSAIRDRSTRHWIAELQLDSLADSEMERLILEVGEERALSLLVLHNLALNSEDAEEEAPPTAATIAEVAWSPSPDLSVIPLAARSVSAPESATEVEPEMESVPALTEPRLKINCRRVPSERPRLGGLTDLVRRARQALAD